MIAVTGANGLLGSFIVRKLIELDEPFIALKRKESDITLLNDVAEKITWRDADVLDPVALTEAFENVTHVIHTAAVVSFNPRRTQYIMDINAQGTRNVANACLSQRVQRLVHISSVAALGRQKHQQQVDEGNKWTENPLNSTYAESKYLAELEVFRAQEEGLSTVIINPSVILAPADWNRSSAQLFKYVWDERPFYTDGSLNYVDVRDVSEITVRLLKDAVQGQRFIVSAGNIAYRNFFGEIAAHFNKKAPGIKLNKPVLQLVSRAETIRCWLIGREPLLTRETARLAGTEFLYRNDKIKKALSYEFQPFEKTLQWCCQYYMTKLKAKNSG